MFHIDSWPWKIALVLALVGMREFVRLISGASGSSQARGGDSNGETGKWLIETLDSAAIAIGLVLFIVQPFLVQAFFIPSGSMEDTLRVDDRLLVSKLVYRLRDPQFQEVVVFRAPPNAHQELETDFIKRCMATPGDIIYATNRRYYRKGKAEGDFELLNEPYTKWGQSGPDGNLIHSYDMKILNGKIYSREYSEPNLPGQWMVDGEPVPDTLQKEVTNARPEPVPPGQFLVLGDHRNNSNDSHAWGFVPRENIVGKAFCVFWPPTRLGVLDRMSFFPRGTERAPRQQLPQQ
jgi:signal peptidase I